MNDTLQHIADLLNDGEDQEALQELRKMHGLVNRWTCICCDYTSAASLAPFRCPKCRGRLVIKVVVEPVEETKQAQACATK